MAADTLKAGPDEIAGGTSRRWPARLIVLAVAGLLLGYAVAHRDTSPGPASSQRAAPSVPAPATSGVRVGLGPPGLRLLVGGPAPRVLDAATGASRRLDLPAAGPRSPAWLVRSGPSMLAFVAVPPSGPSSQRVAYLVGAGRPVLLGPAEDAVAAWGGGAITRSGSQLAGYTADGTLRWQRRVAHPVELEVDTTYGLVVRELPAVTAPAGRLLLTDPVTGAVRRQIGAGVSQVLAVSTAAIAWLSDAACPPDCAVRISEVAGDTTETVGDYFGRAPVTGAFSPDGRQLALSFLSRPGRPTVTADGLVGIVDVAAGAMAVVSGYGGRLILLLPTPFRDRLRVAVSADLASPDGFTLLPWTFSALQSLDIAP